MRSSCILLVAVIGLALAGSSCGTPAGDVVAVFAGGNITREEMVSYLQSGTKPQLRADAAATEEEGATQLIRRYAAEKILASEIDDQEANDKLPVLYLDARTRALVRFYIQLVGKKSYEISDQEVQKAYEELLDSRLTFPELIKLQHIFLRRDRHPQDEARALLASIVDQLDGGASMEEMVAAYSESGTKAQNGILGPVFRGKMDPEFEEQVFSRRNTTAPFVVEVSNGIHLVRILNYTESRAMTFEEAKPQLVSMLVNQRTGAEREVVMAELREKHGVFVAEDWKALAPEAVAIKVGERTLTRAQLETDLERQTALSMRRDVFETDLEATLVDGLVESNLMYLDAIDRGLDHDPLFESNWRLQEMRRKADEARQKRFEHWSEAVSEDQVRSAFNADAKRYFAPPRFEVTYVFVPFLDQDPIARLRLAESIAKALQDGSDEEVGRLSEENNARHVRLGEVTGRQTLGLGPDPQRALMAMQPHEVSEPIRVSGGLVVLSLGEMWPRRALEWPADAEEIRERYLSLHRDQFLRSIDDTTLEEKSFQLLSTDIFQEQALEPGAKSSQ